MRVQVPSCMIAQKAKLNEYKTSIITFSSISKAPKTVPIGKVFLGEILKLLGVSSNRSIYSYDYKVKN